MYTFTSVKRCNDTLKDISVGFDGGRLLTFFLFGFIKEENVGALFLGRGSIFFRHHKPFLHKGHQFNSPAQGCLL